MTDETTNTEQNCVATDCPNELLVMRMRLAILRAACRALLPRDMWIGKQYGAYTRRWDICIGRLDNRGVLQGVLDRDVGA